MIYFPPWNADRISLVRMQEKLSNLEIAEVELAEDNLRLIDKVGIIYFIFCYRSGLQAFIHPEILSNIMCTLQNNNSFFRSDNYLQQVINYLEVMKSYFTEFPYPDLHINELIEVSLSEALEDLKNSTVLEN